MLYPNIRKMRESRDLSQEEISNILGIQRPVYQRYESGKREIPAQLAVRLANYYEISVDILLDNGIVIESDDDNFSSIAERLGKAYDSMVELMKSGAMSDGGIKGMAWVLDCIRRSTISHTTYLEKQLLEYMSKRK